MNQDAKVWRLCRVLPTPQGHGSFSPWPLRCRGVANGEVVALTLDDFDWEAGLVTVRGKGKRMAQMPLPSEVGSAMADYFSTGRPLCSSRRALIRAKAPLTGFSNSVAICSLVDKAMERAGVESEY